MAFNLETHSFGVIWRNGVMHILARCFTSHGIWRSVLAMYMMDMTLVY